MDNIFGTIIFFVIGLVLFFWLLNWASQWLTNPPSIQVPQPRYDFSSPAPSPGASFPARTN